MADQKIFSLIPESLREELISEVKEILEERAAGKQVQQPQTDPVFAKGYTPSRGPVDPAIVAFAKKKNEEAKNKR